ncbi:hypothetical protein [Asticcacaulis sp. AC402]|uniref:hypothetical protein n=1 Tax=Asticcacaulis sp. AC402 TaxID=1282361 RepID=UPI00068C2A68|nr:hypothetical protein [Asticcacaulis sp. AC402]
MVVPESNPGTVTTVTFERPKPKDVPRPVKPATPPAPTPLTIREPEAPAPDSVETTPIAPLKGPDNVAEPMPPVIVSTPGNGPAAAPVPASYVAARWTRFPDSTALMNYYPSRAEADEVVGEALLECTVADARGRVSCIVLSENPRGYGFGKATATMVEKEGRVDTSQGDVPVGSKLRTLVKWTLN